MSNKAVVAVEVVDGFLDPVIWFSAEAEKQNDSIDLKNQFALTEEQHGS